MASRTYWIFNSISAILEFDDKLIHRDKWPRIVDAAWYCIPQMRITSMRNFPDDPLQTYLSSYSMGVPRNG